MNLAQAMKAVKAGKTVTREDRHWRECLRWNKRGLTNSNINRDRPSFICLMHDDVWADDWIVVKD